MEELNRKDYQAAAVVGCLRSRSSSGAAMAEMHLNGLAVHVQTAEQSQNFETGLGYSIYCCVGNYFDYSICCCRLVVDEPVDYSDVQKIARSSCPFWVSSEQIHGNPAQSGPDF